MAPPPIKLIVILWVTSFLVLAVAWFSPYFRFSTDPRMVADNRACDLAFTQCALEFPSQTVLVSIQTSTSKWNTKVRFDIDAALAPKEVTVQGDEMFMGIYSSTVTEVSPNKYRSTVDVPVCSQSTMAWRVELDWPDQLGAVLYTAQRRVSNDE